MTHILYRLENPETEELVMVVLVLDENSNYDIIEHTAPFEITEKQLTDAIKYGEHYTPEADHNNGF
jgi:hypothetical protein